MKCPTCGKEPEPQNNTWRPFCSERCKLIDFGHWADEDYRIPDRSTPVPLEDADERDGNGVRLRAADGR